MREASFTSTIVGLCIIVPVTRGQGAFYGNTAPCKHNFLQEDPTVKPARRFRIQFRLIDSYRQTKSHCVQARSTSIKYCSTPLLDPGVNYLSFSRLKRDRLRLWGQQAS
jgi:hypothetical protein